MIQLPVDLIILATRCTTGPRPGTQMQCILLVDAFSSIKRHLFSHFLGIILLNSSRVMIPLEEVSSKDRWLVSAKLSNSPYIVAHASELPLIFGPVPTPVENGFANALTDYYINFVHDLHPGGIWPQYGDSRHLLQLKRDNLSIIPDGECCYYCTCGCSME